MKKILFFHTQTLHAKVSLPLAFELIRRGQSRIYYRKNRPDLLSFDLKKISKKPTSVSFMNLNSLRYVAGQIDYLSEFDSTRQSIETVFLPSCSGYDAVVSTTKDLPALQEIRRTHNVPAFALGYQHIPVLIKIGTRSPQMKNDIEHSFFFGENSFSIDHRFPDIFKQEPGLILNTFTFLDKVHTYYRDVKDQEKTNTVLVFHPGGYRGILTEPGDPKEISYSQQKEFLERICLPLLESGLTPVVKTHPLPARYHGLTDLQTIAAGLEREHGLEEGAIHVTGECFWQHAYRAAFSLTFGSSSIYELWAAGIKNVYVANFFGTARSRRFSYFPGIYLDTYTDFIDLIRTGRFRDHSFDPFSNTAMRAYEDLFTGNSVETAAEFIIRDLDKRGA